jgi:glyoxylase-like metal-dependent hydrolase (beta-lactamase superfamily II)
VGLPRAGRQKAARGRVFFAPLSCDLPHTNQSFPEDSMSTLVTGLRRGAAALLGSLLFVAAVHAGAPLAKTQPPGFYRLMLGDFEVTALFDGAIDLQPTKLLTNTTPAQVTTLLARSFEKEPLPTSVNAYLVNTGSKLVLIDSGTGGLFGPALGSVVANLKAAGYQPEQVDEIYITHMHGDHIGGLMAEGKAVFANAVVRADQHDADYWLNAANAEKAPAEMKDFFKAATDAFAPYIAAGRFKPFDGDTELVPGVKAVAAHGHTAGHSIYVIESKGQKLVLWGDLIHVAAVQFRQPQVTIAFDSDPKQAAAQRKKAFAEAARQGHLVGAAHLPFPGLGHLRAEGRSYSFVPVDYTPVK